MQEEKRTIAMFCQ